MTAQWIALAAGAVAFATVLLFGLELRVRRRERATLEKTLAEVRLAYDRATADTTVREDGTRYEGPRIPGTPNSLITACLSGECMLFVGSGLAAQAGFPTWRELLTQVIRLHEHDELGDWHNLAERVASAPDQTAEIVASRLSREQLLTDVRNIYASGDRSLPEVYRQLSKVPFRSALTTSYDDLLVDAFTVRSPVTVTMLDAERILALLREQRFIILKLYGDLDRPETFLFNSADYTIALGSDPSLERTVASLFLSNTVFFIGVSLDRIENFVSSLRIRYETRARQHYALVPWQPDVDVEQERFRARYGIELMPYLPGPGHPETTEFIARIADRMTPASRSVGPPATLQPALIESIRLENFGPFRSLELDLHRQWNVLLGNNGSGKSTVLKAIALALCGNEERARGAGEKLLRAGASRGSVEVTVGSDVYRTELVRDLNGVSVRALQLTPLQTATWVILGFPPVRGITSRNPPPSTETSAHPVVDDVLPLLLTATDERLDDIKGWLVSQALRAEGGRGVSSQESARAQKLLDSFFGFLDDLTPGFQLKFDSVDRSTWQVMIKTVDGTIPIDLISQGMVSVLGWVGTLLHRMHEIYRESTEPETEAAVVLVDEVDAHMHPEWQKTLIPVLKARLPRLQLVATTHSPLVAGAMETSEVTRIRRAEDSSDILVEPINESLKGMRADQILTSPAFDLDTTRDIDTVRMMRRYSELLGLTSRTKEQDAEFTAVSSELRETVPTFHETRVARQADDVLEAAMLQRLQDRPAEEKQRILEEANRSIAEIISRLGRH